MENVGKQEERDWRDVEDTAEKFGVSKAVVYGWIRRQEVSVKTSTSFRRGRYLVDIASVRRGSKP